MDPVRQLRLLAAGCQPWHRPVCAAAPPLVAYAAAQSVYVYRRHTDADSRNAQWQLQCILTRHTKLIRCVAWTSSSCPLATAAADRLICLWNVQQQALIARLSVDDAAQQLVWLPNASQRTLLFSGARGPVLLWRTDSAPVPELYRSDQAAPFAADIAAFVGHPRHDKAAVAHSNCTLTLIASTGRIRRHQRLPEPYAEEIVTGLAWEPLSDDYLLICTEQAGMLLLDTSTFTLIQSYGKPSCGSQCQIEWFTNAPGMFLTADSKPGVIRIYSASSDTPIEQLYLKPAGFHEVKLMHEESDSSRYAAGSIPPGRVFGAFVDGGVGVYCLKSRQWEWLQTSGHTETVFDVKFQPDSPEHMATASFDGTVKVWNVHSLETTHEFRLDSPVYAISWAPADLQCLVAATAKNGLVLISLERSRVIRHFREHGATAVYSAAWCQVDSRRLASGGGDARCVVRQVDGTLLKQYQHPETVHGCDWRDASVLATTCADGVVRVYDVNSAAAAADAPLFQLKGHTQRSFQARWHPVLHNVMASSSDDGTIRVWDVRQRCSISLLTGHHTKVRALTWCPELIHVLLSGSWDYTIRVWDVKTCRCLHTVKEHAADVYGLSIHPSRPFLVVSCSRDSTIRLWDIAPLLSTLLCKILVANEASEVIMSSLPVSIEETCADMVLSGAQGLHIFNRWKDESVRLLLLVRLIASDPDGVNLHDLLSVCLGETDMSRLSSAYTDGIVHKTHLKASMTAKATRMEKTSPAVLKNVAFSSEQQKRHTARLYLRCGQLRRFCEILADLGDWNTALAVAPGVSLDYWRQLSLQRAASLAAVGDYTAEIYQTAAGRPDKTVELYQRRGDPLTALQIRIICAEGHHAEEETAEIQNNSHQLTAPQTATAKPTLVDSFPHSDMNVAAQWCLEQGRPLLAACVGLCVGDVIGCVKWLSRGHQCELAVIIWKLLAPTNQTDAIEEALICLSRRCLRDQQWETAIKLANLIQNKEIRLHQLREACLLSHGDTHRHETIYQLAGFEPFTSFLSNAESETNRTVKATMYLLAMQYEKGLTLAIEDINDSIHSAEPTEQTSTLRLLSLCSIAISDHRRRLSQLLPRLVILSGYSGALEAARRGQRELAALLLEHTGLALSEIDEAPPSITGEHLRQMQQYLDPISPSWGDSFLHGCHLPGHGRISRCYISGRVIRGPVYTLGDGETTIAGKLAVMWSAVNRLSPLNTGELMYG